MSFIQTDDVELLVAGEKITGDLKAELTISDLNSEMDTVSAQLQWWNGVLAAAKAEHEQLDAAYRQWRARESLVILEKDKTLAEWKVKLRLEASDKFMRHKNAKALSVRNITQLEGIVEAFRVKAQQMQSKGANLREGLKYDGMHTPSSPKRARSRVAPPDEGDEADDEHEAPTPKSDERKAREQRVKDKIKKRKGE